MPTCWIVFCQCFMNNNQTAELIFEQQGQTRTTFNTEHYQTLIISKGIPS
jgi:hypothetical protein